MKNYLNILFLFLASVSLVNAQSINLELPRITAATGDTVTIPIQVSNLSSAVAFQLRFSYQTNSLRYVGYDSVGTALQGRTFEVNDDSSSTRISDFTFLTLNQSNGVLLKLKYVFLGSPSSLVWNAIQTEFTVGTTATKPTLTHGTIGHSSSGITISSFPLSNTFCEADTATASVSGAGAGTYQWQISTDTLGGSFVNINGATSNNLSIPAIDRLNYNGKFIQVLVKGTSTNSNFGLVTPPVKIYVNENIPVQVTVNANPSGAICQGTSVTYTASSSSTINDLIYTWKINDIVVETGPSITRNNLINGDQITCIASSTSTCVSTSSNSSNSVTASVNALPVVTMDPITSLCVGATAITLTGGSPSSGGTGVYTVGGLTASTFNPTSAGSFNVIYTFTDSNGCSASASTSLVVNAPDAVSISADNDTISIGGSVTLTATSISGASYNWSDGSASAGSGQIIVASPSSTTTYSVSITNSATGCTSTASKTITVLAAPSVNAGSDTSICQGSANLSLSGTPSGGTWSGQFITGDSFNPINPGTYYLIYSYEQLNVDYFDTLIVTVLENPTVFTLSGGGSYCQGGNGKSLTLNGSESTASYQLWKDGIPYLVNGSPFVQSGTGSTLIFGPLTEIGTYTVKANYPNSCFSEMSGSESISITSNPIFSISAVADTLLLGSNVNLSANNLSGHSYLWSPSSVFNNPTVRNPVLSASNVGKLVFSLTVTNPNTGCSATQFDSVIIIPGLSVNAGPDRIFCQNDPTLTLDFGLPSGGIWSGLQVNNGVFTPTQAGTFNVIYSLNYFGRTFTDTAVYTVNVKPNATIQLNATYCLNEVIQLNSGLPAGGSYYINNQLVSGSYSAPSPGIYQVDYIFNNGLCSDTVSQSFEVKSLSQNAIDTVICSGTSFTVGGQTFSESGNYTITLTAYNNCDSIITLNLIVLNPINTNLNQIICGGQTFVLGTQNLNTSGTYSYTTTAANGCDSTVNLDLTVLPISITSLNNSICEGETYTFDGQILSNSGSYSDTLIGFNGCDSIVNLSLTVLNNSSFTLDANICNGIIYTFGSQSLSTSGTFFRTLTAANGCDSVVTLNLTVLPNSSSSMNASICDGQSYTFGSQTLTTGGTYTNTITAANGCDSVVTLNLTVRPNSSSSMNASICDGQSYSFGSQTLTTGGTYTNTLTAANGCDSVVTLNLTVRPNSSSSMDASICNGQSYTFGSQTLTTGGTYTNTLTAANGCDSVVTLNLTVLPNSSSSMDASICNGQSYTFGSQTLTTGGTYTNTLTAANGCDSVVTLNLTVLPNSSSSMDASICNGQSYTFGSQTLTTGGIYTNTITAANGCDSVVTLNLTVLPNSSSSMNASICDGQSYSFGSQTLITGGTYTNTLTAANGCDSVVTLNLTVLPNSSSSMNASICDGQSYSFGSQTLITGGTYTNTLTAANGCDSVVTLNLTVLPNSSSSMDASICNGQSYTFGSQTLITGGTYTNTLTAANGCDSVVTLNLTVLPNSSSSMNASICDGQSYSFGSQTLITGGTYTNTLTAANGCDSVVTLNLTVLPNSSSSMDASICNGQSYTFGSQTLTTGGTYTNTLTAANGCDSVVTLNLTVRPNSSSSMDASICNGQSYTFGSQTLTTGGTYTNTLTAANGCDSVVTLNLTVRPNSSSSMNASICDGQSYSFGSQTLTTGGTYTNTVTAANGCDSVVTLNLTVRPNSSSSMDASICNGQSYTFGSQTLITGGTYTNTLTAANGCDSVVTLNLTVRPNSSSSMDASICNGQSYTFGSQTLITGGTYTNTLTAANGCDSVVTLNLTVLPNSSSSMDASICDGQSYSFGSQTLTTSGTYTNTLTAANGCDSVVTLNLTVRPNSSSSMDASICNGQSYTFGSQTLTTGGTYTNTITAANGCDSVVTLNLTVRPNSSSSMDASICNGQSYTFGSQTLITGGTYTNTLTAANGCDSVVTLNLTVRPNSSSSMDASICNGQSYTFGSQTLITGGIYTNTITAANGCDSVVTLNLTVLPNSSSSMNASICEGQSYTFGSQTLTTGGTYTNTVTAANGCDSVVTLNLTILTPVNTTLTADTSICLGSSITLEANGGANYLWSTGETTPVIAVTPTATTTYSVTITGVNGCSKTRSVVVAIFNSSPVNIAGNSLQSVCSGSSIQLNATGSTTYFWSPISGLDNPNIPNPIASPSITTTYTVIGISPDGCISTDTVRVEVIEPTSLTFISVGSLCSNGPAVQLQAQPQGGMFSGLGVSNGQFNPATTGSGIFTVQYLYVDLNGCSSTISQNIEVLAAPSANAGADQTICRGSTAILNASGGGTYAWSNGETTPNIQVSPTVTTTYSVIITNTAGCNDTDYVTVTVNPLPTITYSGSISICEGGSTQITLIGANSYVWSPALGVSNSNTSNPVLSPSQTTTYTVTGTDANGCNNSLQITIVVNPPFRVNAGSDMVFCGTPVTLNASSTIQGATYQWSNGGNTAAITVSPINTTSYIVFATSPEGCSYSDTVIVYVPSAFAGSGYNICRGASIQLSGNLAQYPFAGTLQYSWSPSTGLNNPNLANPVASPTVTTTYSLTITTPEGCQLSTTTSVVISPTPDIRLGSDFSLAPGSTIQLIPALLNVQAGRTIAWSYLGSNTNGSLNLTSIPNPIFTANSVTVPTTTMWVLTISNSNGCSGSDTIAITVNPSLSGFVLSGRLLYDNTSESPVNNGFAYLIHSNGTKDSVALSPSGSYLFVGLQNGNYRLTTSTFKAFGGITTADASLINIYALGLGGLSGLKLKAADVTTIANNPGNGIYILGNDAQQTAMRAADLSINFSFDNGGPGNWYHDTVDLVINNQNRQQNIRAISYGDVNASYSPVFRRDHLLNIENHGNIEVEASKELVLPISPMSDLSTSSFQFEIEVPQGFELTNARIPGLNEPIYLSQNGRIAIVGWYSVLGLPVDFKANNVMILLSFNAPSDHSLLNSSLLMSFLGRSEVANLAGEPMSVRLSIPILSQKSNHISDGFALYPNPVTHGNALYLKIPPKVTGEISIHLRDRLGRLVLTLPKTLIIGQKYIDVSEIMNSLSAGSYTLNLVQSDDKVKTSINLPFIIKF